MQAQHSFIQIPMHGNAVSKRRTPRGEIGTLHNRSNLIGCEIGQLGLHAYFLPLTSLVSIDTTNGGVGPRFLRLFPYPSLLLVNVIMCTLSFGARICVKGVHLAVLFKPLLQFLRAFYGVAQLNRLEAANFTEKSRVFIQTLQIGMNPRFRSRI